MSDPVGDLRREVEGLKRDLGDQRERFADRLRNIDDDLKRIEKSQEGYVTKESHEWVVWSLRLLIAGLVLATFGGIVAIAIGRS